MSKKALIKTNKKNFFRYWLIFTKPLHKLSDRDIDVAALLLYHYFELRKKVDDEELAWKLTFDHDTRVNIISELNLSSDQILRNILTSLRKNKVVTDNKVNPSFIPVLDDTNVFSLTFNFEING